jgi:Flp pilus assembly protein TadG
MRIQLPIREVTKLIRSLPRTYSNDDGSQIVELAVSLPLLVVFVVGIFDFSGALTLKQKLTSAAQEAAVIAASQPTRDVDRGAPASVLAVGDAAFDFLASGKTLANANVGGCTKAAANLAKIGGTKPVWTYEVDGCPDNLIITIDRANVSTYSGEKVLASHVTVQYSYSWRFNDVINLVAPGATYAATTNLIEEATALNQL